MASITPDYAVFLNSIDAEHRDRVDTLLQGAVTGINGYDTDFPINLPDGEVRQLRAMAQVGCNPAGEAVRMIGTNWDVTEHRRLVSLAEQAARSKSEFLATISHELRTPLNSIIGFSRLVLDGAPPGEAKLPPTAKRHIELVRDASTTLLTIVDDVLDYSRIEAGGFEINPTPFELRPMVETAVEIVRAGAEERGLSLSLLVAPDIAQFVIGDQTRLRQILLNLLGNAIKFTASGQVSVALSMVDGGNVRWDIRDTGIGIPKDKQHLLFRRFSQVDQSIARRFGGSGLGLAICERLVTAMGGTIGLTNECGVRSVFWFATPLSATEAAALLGRVAPITGRRAAERRILLAEDVEMN